MTVMLDVHVRRIFDDPARSDGIRVLVDRRWPRGVSKTRTELDEWCPEVAPSDALRRWYDHRSDRFHEFRDRYCAELEEPERAALLRHLKDMAAYDRLTLLTGTRQIELSHAVVLTDQIHA